jgi:ribosomal protein S12 methylthiotransferase accessory factor
VAYRPASLTYAVSLGTGTTVAQSRVSAVMESIETWHAENLCLPIAARATAAALHLDYDVRTLNLAPRSPLTSAVVLDWVSGRGLLSGREILAPVDCIRLDETRPRDWGAVYFWPTSAGLATGSSFADAVLHGLHELVERASLANYWGVPPSRRCYVDPWSCQDPAARGILQALKAAECAVTVCDVTVLAGLPCYAATVWSDDLPMRCSGFGCHVNSSIALGRAMSEAVLTRLAAISGARDDIDSTLYREMAKPDRPARLARVRADAGGADVRDMQSTVRRVACLVAAAAGTEPLAVRLDHEELGIPAVKVIAPGLRTACARPVPAP